MRGFAIGRDGSRMLVLCTPILVALAVPVLARGQSLSHTTETEWPGITLPDSASPAQRAEEKSSWISFDLPEAPAASDSPADQLSRIPSNLNSDAFIEPRYPTRENIPPKWRVANQESLLFTGIMHGFNLWTEAGTRDTLNGHWLQDYLDSVGELRGWSDSDTFMSPYIGHTIEGSVFGYIERQNDPQFRAVQWGDGRVYFISLLRSMAFSAVWHTQWKIGPISEASIGNVMLHASPGFITLTDTPTLGTVEMMGEDALDRYLIMGIENRTANQPLILLVRSFLNPGRSFANLMAIRSPWHRETRMGILNKNHVIRQELIKSYRETGEKPFEYIRPQKTDVERNRTYPKEASIELTAFPLYESFLAGGSCVGGGGSGAARIDSHWQFVAELSGCQVMHMPASNQSGDSLFYGGGLRWTPRASHSISPYIEMMLGGKKVTHEIDDLELRKVLMAEWNNGNGTLPHYPKRSDWSVEVVHNGPTVKIGGGFDVVVARPFAWRLLDIAYSHAWISDSDMIHPQNTLRISTGAVLRIGTW